MNCPAYIYICKEAPHLRVIFFFLGEPSEAGQRTGSKNHGPRRGVENENDTLLETNEFRPVKALVESMMIFVFIYIYICI